MYLKQLVYNLNSSAEKNALYLNQAQRAVEHSQGKWKLREAQNMKTAQIYTFGNNTISKRVRILYSANQYITQQGQKIYFKLMKTKKHLTMISSIVGETILQCRNTSHQILAKRLSIYQQRISRMHEANEYSKQLYFELIEKQQYGIEQKLMAKEHRLVKQTNILIHFKLTEKLNSHISLIESWLVSTTKHTIAIKANKIDCTEEMIYLLQQLLRALRCQFLTEFLSMGQQFRSKYILDYDIEVNPNKKTLRKLQPLHYEHIWKKQAFIDQQHKMTVTCFHNTHTKLLSIISQKYESRSLQVKPHLKHGSEETKPSNSGQYELSTSVEEKGIHGRERKTSMIEFYDEDLNITVLSSDSEKFKKSTGRIEGVFVGQNPGFDEDEDEFQLLIEESAQEELEKEEKAEKEFVRIREVEKKFEEQLFSLDQKVVQYFF